MPNRNRLHTKQDSDFDLRQLLNPAQAYSHPQDVVDDPDLTLKEKRAVLAGWASDACAVEATPSLRRAPGGQRAVPIDDIFEALAALDKAARIQGATQWARRQVRREAIETIRQRRKGMGPQTQSSLH